MRDFYKSNYKSNLILIFKNLKNKQKRPRIIGLKRNHYNILNNMLLYTKWMELPAITFKSLLIKDNVSYTVKYLCKLNIAPAK